MASGPEPTFRKILLIVRKSDVLCFVALTVLLSYSIGVSDVLADDSTGEIVRSIYEYDIEYQERARDVATEKMSHWPEESYVRWRPVRVEPKQVLQEKSISENALPEFIQLTVFPDLIVNAQNTGYFFDDANGGAIWSGVIPGFDLSNVEISIVDFTDKLAGTEDRLAFVIRIWIPPRHLYVFPTDDLDVYVAIEGRVADDTDPEWAPYN